MRLRCTDDNGLGHSGKGTRGWGFWNYSDPSNADVAWFWSASEESHPSLVGLQAMVALDSSTVFQQLLPDIDMTEWHIYRVEFFSTGTRFLVDGNEVASTPYYPGKPQRIEIWIDNYIVQIQGGDVVPIGYLDVSQDQKMYIDWVRYYDYSNRPPALDTIGNKTVNEGELLEFTVTATDPDGDNLTCSASNLPPGAEFYPSSQIFSWAPEYSQVGVYSNVLFTVTDDGNPPLSDEEEITITVERNAPDEPSCEDGILNQGEDLIDCGGPCQACDCLVDGDCADELFCNGAESCNDYGECQVGIYPCPGQLCDEVYGCVDCYDDGDCDDGLFCNGAESCDGGVCQAASDPCPVQGCDEVNDECVAEPTAKMETGMVTVGGDYVTVNLVNTYVSPVVVCSIQYNNNTTPIVNRVRNVTSTSFDVWLQNPSGSVVSAENVSYLVVEEGAWTIDGVKIEAQTYLSTVTDNSNSWVGETQSYGQSYTNPVVIGQVMSENDDDWSLFCCQGSTRSDPPSATELKTGKTVCEDSDFNREDETIGFIVFEAGHGTIGGVEFEAFVGPDTIKGVTNSPPYTYNFDTTFGSAPQVAVTTMAGMDGGNGGWAYVHGSTLATTTSLYLSIDEDQIGDSERNHTTEQVGYVVFETALVYPAAECEVPTDCDDGLFCNGAEDCVDGTCHSGSAPCPNQACDEVNDICVDCIDGGDCDDGEFCNGVETCIGGVCQAGTTVDCSDGVDCTIDLCNESTDSCNNAPDHAACTDGLFCNGAETCNLVSGCQTGSNPCPGLDCDEANDICVECLVDGDCDDGLWCNGAEDCADGICVLGTAPVCDDGISCTADSCNEDTDSCDNVPDDASCNDGNDCTNGTCNAASGCEYNMIPDCCGNGSCESGEDICTCPEDCGTPPSTEIDCSDGSDNDCDALIDDDDPDCSSCLPNRSWCSSDAECCSNNCSGFWIFKWCR